MFGIFNKLKSGIYITIFIIVAAAIAADIFLSADSILKSIFESIADNWKFILIPFLVIIFLWLVYEYKKCTGGRWISKLEIDSICNNTWQYILIWSWYIIGFFGLAGFIVYYSTTEKVKNVFRDKRE